MKKIAIIPARAGSKGLPNKNVLLAYGKPLIAYTIEAALESKQFDLIVVTTDSLEYKAAISHYPIKVVIRDESLADDNASSYVVIKDVLERDFEIKYDYFVLLQPTSPLRTAQHIIEGIQKFEKNMDRFDFLVSMTKASKSSHLLRNIGADESLSEYNLTYSNYARQKYNEYCPNGAIYIAKPDKYLKKGDFYGKDSLAYFMEKEDSLDIDDGLDFDIFLFFLEQKQRNKKTENEIINKIKIKSQQDLNKDITLIGDSIFDLWSIKETQGKSICNMGISKISTRQYIDLIIDKNIISQFGKNIFLSLGRNDLLIPNISEQEIISSIQEIISKLGKLSPDSHLFVLEIPLTAFRKDRENKKIIAVNNILKSNITQFISLDSLNDQYGKLNLAYTDDGLNLNATGYEVLENIMKPYLF